MRREPGVRVTAVDPAGWAASLGVAPGARLLSVNGEPVRDEIDLVFNGVDEEVEVEFIDHKGSRKRKTLTKPCGSPLGLEIAPFRPRACRNKCIFCFVDQNPPGLRPALYFKDDDLRLSFSHGHYITATNLRPQDTQRILEQRLAPLYVSVHATRHDLRCQMLGVDPAITPDMMEFLRFLDSHRISFHTQIVLCPGWNDGPELDKTLDDLETLFPSLLSVAVVPVGLTGHRDGLEPLKPLTARVARRVIEQVEPRQKRLRRRRGGVGRVVLLADEFYLMAGKELPRYSPDEISCQIENGVGMVATFWEGWSRAARRIPRRVDSPTRVALMTGLLGARVLEPLVERLCGPQNLHVDIVPIENTLYGPGVTVSGLLPGRDFDRTMDRLPGDFNLVLLPANSLRPEDQRFLDDLTLETLRRRHKTFRIEPVEGGAEDIVSLILETAAHV